MIAHPKSRRRAGAATVLAAFATLLAFAGCSSSATTQRELTERQRDSTLGRTNIPGASVVTRALAASDKAAAQAAQMDAQVSSEDH